MQEEGEGLVSKLTWKIRPTETLKLQSIKIVEGKYVSLVNGSKQRVLALMRVRLMESSEETKLDYAATMRITLQQQRMKGLFDGLYRAEVPFLYISMMVPSSEEADEKEVFEFDLVVATWVDTKGKELELALQDLEQRASVLAATMTVALPSAQVRRLCRNELRDFVKTLFLPSDPHLPQTGSASVVSTLETFDSRNPMAGPADQAPRFYIPNAAESGKSGILVGKVRSTGGDLHDFYLRLDDLKRHVGIMGMSVDHDEPILCRRQGKVCIEKIGTLVDSYFGDGQEGRTFPTGLECVAFDPVIGSTHWSPIGYVLRHRYAGKMLRIGLETGRSVTVTPNHSLFALANGVIKQVDASDLRLGDFVVGPNSIPDLSLHAESINLIELLKSEEGVFLYNVPSAVFDRIDIPGKRTLKHDRRLPVGFASLLGPEEAALVTIGYKAARKTLRTTLSVDEDFARLLGFYAAQGSLSINSKRNYTVQFTFGPTDRDAIKDCQRILLEKFGVSTRDRAHGVRSTRLQFGHRILAIMLASLVRRGAKNKLFPAVILNSPSAVRRAFIEAWVNGDSGVTVSQELMNGVAYALLLDGCLSTVSFWKQRTGTVIEGRKVRSLPAYHLRFPEAKSYGSNGAPLQRTFGYEPVYPMAQIPNPLSLVYGKRATRTRLSKRMLGDIEARLRKLESYSSCGAVDAKRDGFYRSYSSRSLKRRGERILARQELKVAREELEGLKLLARSKLSFLRVTRIEQVTPSSQFVYDVSVPAKENFLAGFGGVFCHNTGSGKSTTASAIVKQVAEMGLPLLILDWHNEYGSMISKVGGQVFSPGKDDFAINPVEVLPSADPIEHIAMVTDIFSDIYHFTHPQAYMFRNALQKRVAESSDEEIPGLASLVRTIEAYPLRSAYDNETKVALLRRLVPLTQGQAGKALDGPSTTGIEELMGKVACVELGHLRDMQTRSVFTDIMLKMVYEYRVQRRTGLEHLTLVEEARNVVPARRPEDPPSVGERMISELRKFGEAMVFVAQFPTQVASEVIKNSGVRIIHRIAWPEDIALIGDSLSLTRDQREHVGRLQVGETVISLSRLQKPILVQVRGDLAVLSESKDLNFTAEA